MGTVPDQGNALGRSAVTQTGVGKSAIASEQGEKQPVQDHPVPFADMAPLVRRLHAWIDDHPGSRTVQLSIPDLQVFSRLTGFTPRRAGTPEVILASDTAIELGHPTMESLVFPLMTSVPGLVRHGRLTTVGPGFACTGRPGKTGGSTVRLPLGQVVALEVEAENPPDPFDVDNLQFLLHRLPGYMVRSVPGRLWVRIGKEALSRGLSVEVVAQALMLSFLNECPTVRGVEVLWVTSCVDDIRSLRPLENEASILAGKHKKLVLTQNGEVECPDLDCDHCEARDVCDALRDIIVLRRRR